MSEKFTKMFSIGGERDPVVVYKIYCEKWPENMLSDAPFSLAVNHTRKKDSTKKWFKSAPVGSNKLTTLMKTMASEANLNTFPFQLTLLPLLLLFKVKVVSLKQKGGGKEFELRSQTPTKQPWTQISQLYFISFGFYLSSFAFYEAAFFQWLLFDHTCLNKACHNLRRMFNLSMYITNIIPHGKCFVRCLHIHCFVSEISLVRFAHLFDFWYTTTHV